MKKTLQGMPGPLAHACCALLCLLLTAALLAMGLAFPLTGLLCSRGLNLAMAQDSALISAQYARIGAQVDELAQRYPFEPKTVMDRVTPALLTDYAAALVDWRLGLLQPEADFDPPAFPLEGLVDAIKADETFRAATPEAQRTTVARDQIAAQVEKIVAQAAAPVRLSLLSLVLAQALPRLAPWTHYVPYLPWALALCAGLLMGLMALCAHKRVIRGVLYMGAGCAAAGLCLAALGAWAALARLPQALAAYSQLLGLQLALLLRRLAWPYGGLALGLMILGLGLIGVHQRRMARLRQAAAFTEAA